MNLLSRFRKILIYQFIYLKFAQILIFQKFIKLLNDEIEPELIDSIIDRHFEGQERQHFYDRDYEIDYNKDNVEEEEKEEDLKNTINENTKNIEILKKILQKKEVNEKIMREDILDVQRKADMLAQSPVTLNNNNNNTAKEKY